MLFVQCLKFNRAFESAVTDSRCVLFIRLIQFPCDMLQQNKVGSVK